MCIISMCKSPPSTGPQLLRDRGGTHLLSSLRHTQSWRDAEAEKVAVEPPSSTFPVTFWVVKPELYLSGTRWWAPRPGRPAAHGWDRCVPEQWRPDDPTGAAWNTQKSSPCATQPISPEPHQLGPTVQKGLITKLLHSKN